MMRSASRMALAALFCIALAASLSHCGGKKEAGEVELVIWEQMDPEEQALLKRHLETFKAKHPGLEITTAHFETDLLHSQFQTAALAGGGPDLVYGPSDKVGPYSVMELIKPLESLFDEKFFAKYEKTSIAMLDGRIYAVPDQIGNHLMLLYNKEMVSKRPADSDELIAMCKELTIDSNNDGFPDQYGLVFNFNEPFWLIPFLGAFGGSVIDADNNPTLDTPAMVQTLRFMADLKNRHKILPKESDYPLSDTMFKKSQAAFIINGPWSIKGYISAGIDLGVVPIPVITETGMHPSPMVSSKGYSINVNVSDERLELVKELLEYLTSKDVQKKIVSELLILPSISELYTDPSLLENEILKGSMEQARLGRPMPVVPEMRAVWDAIRPYYQSVLGGKMNPEEAVERMQQQAEKKIREMQG